MNVTLQAKLERMIALENAFFEPPFRFSFTPEINPLKLTLVLILFKNSARTSKRTPHFPLQRSTG
jgi:hypothetical protein